MGTIFRIPLVASAIMLATASTALAVTITYIYSGVGSGSLAVTSFEDAEFTIIATADTDDIGPWCCGDLQNTHVSTTIEIAGIGTVLITTPSHTWIAEECCGGLGQNLGINWITIFEAGFNDVSYGLDSALGPVFEDDPFSTQFKDVATSGGALSFTAMDHVIFEAVTPTDTAAPIPEPSSLLLLGTGLVSAVAARRRSKRA